MVMYFPAMARLAKEYRIVMFDNCCKGLNTKLEETKGIESPESAQEWMLEFITKTIDALSLPSKFLLAGHSYGGFLVSLYASKKPERVMSLFLLSSANLEPFDESTYDPTSFSHSKDPTRHWTLREVEAMNQ